MSRDEAIRAALFAHDGMMLLLDQGLDREAVEPEPVGFIAALEALGYTVVPIPGLDAEELHHSAPWNDTSD